MFMKIINQSTNHYLLRFDLDEEVISGLSQFAKEHTISAATFSAIGAAKEVTLAYYNLETKQYEDREINQDVEILGIIGNIAILNNDIAIHCHGSFGDRNFDVVGGHVKRLVVSATCEVSLTTLEGKMEREYDQKTGLNLLK